MECASSIDSKPYKRWNLHTKCWTLYVYRTWLSANPFITEPNVEEPKLFCDSVKLCGILESNYFRRIHSLIRFMDVQTFPLCQITTFFDIQFVSLFVCWPPMEISNNSEYAERSQCTRDNPHSKHLPQGE